MKSISLRIFLLIFCCLNIYGQQKEITRQEYSDALMSKYQPSSNKSYRSISNTETFSILDGKLTRKENSVFEYLSSEKNRQIVIESIDGVTKKNEMIMIGSIVYQRIDDGEWKEKGLEVNGFIPSNIISSGVFEIKWVSKYTFVETAFNNQTVHLYEKNIKHRDGKFFHEKFWLNKEGLILKIESRSGLINPERLETHKVTDYEYDSDIKIEAPKMSLKKP